MSPETRNKTKLKPAAPPPKGQPEAVKVPAKPPDADRDEAKANPAPSAPVTPSRFSETQFSALLNEAERNFGKGSLMRLENNAAAPIDIIESGSVALDKA